MPLSSALNSSRLCWHWSCEISAQWRCGCLSNLKCSLLTVAPLYSLFNLKAEKKLMWHFGSCQGTAVSTSLALHWPVIKQFIQIGTSLLILTDADMCVTHVCSQVCVYAVCMYVFVCEWHCSVYQLIIALLGIFFFFFFSLVLEMAKCEFSASRWDWWACAMQTSKRSINVSLMPAHVPNASPQLQTMSQNKTVLIASVT